MIFLRYRAIFFVLKVKNVFQMINNMVYFMVCGVGDNDNNKYDVKGFEYCLPCCYIFTIFVWFSSAKSGKI